MFLSLEETAVTVAVETFITSTSLSSTTFSASVITPSALITIFCRPASVVVWLYAANVSSSVNAEVALPSIRASK